MPRRTGLATVDPRRKKHIVGFCGALLCCSCSTVKNPEPPTPPINAEGSFHLVEDGSRIFVHEFTPRDDYHASIFVLSGITGINHERERALIELLSNGENRVVVIHPRGTGYSDGKRGDIARFSDFIDDYIEIITSDRDYHPSKRSKAHPLVAYGHSMSTAVALSIIVKAEGIDGAILVNPPYMLKKTKGMSPSAGQYCKYAFYSIFARHKPVVDMAGDPEKMQNADDRQEARDRANDPLIVRYFSMYYLTKSRAMMKAMVDHAEMAECPLLLIYGMKDSLVDEEGCDRIFEAWKHPSKKYVRIPDGPHGKRTVIEANSAIHAWLHAL